MKKENALDLLISAKKSFIINIVGVIVIIIAVLFQILYQNKINSDIQKRIHERDILIVTNTGMLTGKTIPDFKIIAKQFAEVVFNSTLNYSNTNVLPQLNFMRIYASPKIYENYKSQIMEDREKIKLENKISYAYLDTSKNIKIETLEPNKKYRVTLYGIKTLTSKLQEKKERIKLVVTLKKSLNTGLENIFGIEIVGYNLTKLK